MNHWDFSPVMQTNEAAGNGTPKEDSPAAQPARKQDAKYHFLAEDLQKIRRSNHSSHQEKPPDAMDDNEHEGIIKGLLYPGLEEVDDEDEFDFFEEDYQAAQEVVRSSAAGGSGPSPMEEDASDNHAVHRRTLDISMLDEPDDSYFSSYLSSMGRPYSDLSSQKLPR
eukprot:Nitzschia sp. Nitz4//scaffold44_size153857//132865//133365//NITZ4_002745-RA/size153857-processed-gene-0.169-mRNA-1//-1//CDS//3329552229//6250//frame0